MSRQHTEPSALFLIFTALGYDCFIISARGTLTAVSGYTEEGDYLFVHPSHMGTAALARWMA